MLTDMKIVVEAGEGDSVSLGGIGVDFMVPGEMTGGLVSIVEHPLDPGRLIPPHIHYREEETFSILSGRVEFTVGGQTIEAGPGEGQASRGTVVLLHGASANGMDPMQAFGRRLAGARGAARFDLDISQLHVQLSEPRYAGRALVDSTVHLRLYPRRASPVRMILTYDFDLIDAHYFYPDGVAAVLLGQALGRPVVITARGDDLVMEPFGIDRAQLEYLGGHRPLMAARIRRRKTRGRSGWSAAFPAGPGRDRARARRAASRPWPYPAGSWSAPACSAG